MRIFILPLILAALAIIRGNALAETASPAPSRITNYPQSTPAPVPPTDIREITLDQWGGLGNAYGTFRATIQANGGVRYHGEYGVDRIGWYTGSVNFPVVAAWLEASNIDEIAHDYDAPGWVTLDAPGVTLTVVRKAATETLSTSDIAHLPPRAVGVIFGLDGFLDAVRWHPASALDSYLGFFVDQGVPERLTTLEISESFDASKEIANGDIWTLIAGQCRTHDSILPDLAIFKSGARYVLRRLRHVAPPCTFPCGVPTSTIETALGDSSIAMKYGGSRYNFRHVTGWEYAELADHFCARKSALTGTEEFHNPE